GGAPGDPPLASIVLLTYNRISMLRLCLARVLETTHDVNCEIIVWDNASSDGTAAYLDETAANDPRLRVVHSLENVGLNGVARGVALARGAYIVEMDDDIIDMPEGWLSGMIHAFDTVPRAGFLAANVVDDEITNGAKPPADQYRAQAHGDVVIEYGPTGGWCAMTSRAVIDRIGNFIEQPDKVFFLEDGEFGQRCRRAFLRVGIVRDVVVYHAAGPLANAKFGCLDVCEEKYSRDPDLKPWLDATRELKVRQSDG
ncbi:MAG TPA: glycosyltransferase, partial [Coriobacteriia bacterium]